MAAPVDRSDYLLGVIPGILGSRVNTQWSATLRATGAIESCANVALSAIINSPAVALGILNGSGNFFFAMPLFAHFTGIDL